MNSAARTLSPMASELRRDVASRAPIALWTPPHRRLAGAIAAAARRLRDALRESAERRAQVRLARRRQAALASLDARTLRDIGLGDWMASASEADAAQLQRDLRLRGF